MTIENDIDLLVSDVTTRKAAVVKAKGDLDAIVAEGASAAAQAESAVLAAQSARDEASAMATASGALATAYVGATAYADLAAVVASKVEGAADVFIYDTSLDSDGGAWRYRTQWTSWYREALNTATRGIRREFPAVAVIVVEAEKVTIFDADDPALPMWMVIQSGSGALPSIWRTNRPALCAAMLNGVLCIGLSGSDVGYTGLYVAEFVSDEVYRRNPLGTYGAGLTVARRNDQSTLVTVISATAILNGTVGDVAMTALPDATVDPATGLSVPTIFAQTAGGLSRISHDGVVTNDAAGWPDGYAKLGFSGDYLVKMVPTDPFYNYMQARHIADPATTTWINWGVKNLFGGVVPGTIYGKAYAQKAFSTNRSLVHHAPHPIMPTIGMEGYVGSSYFSGWMPNDIKGAWLGDTDVADLVGDGTLAASDRSVNANDLTIFGRLRRTPVADGAELVAYSGFSAANYLEGTDASYVNTLYALGWEQTNGRWEFKHGVVSAAPIDGLTVTGNTIRIAGTKPKALIRLIATVPTADQIAKIEADERTLFQPGAACTLYGDSDAVTALAYDKVTNLLHVGTAAGRSVFDGLRRVAHTTSPVGNAIAAHNGLIIEG